MYDPADVWLEVSCNGACECQIGDVLPAWPELPQRPSAAVRWVREHGCPDCGSLDVAVAAAWEDDDGVTHRVGDEGLC